MVLIDENEDEEMGYKSLMKMKWPEFGEEIVAVLVAVVEQLGRTYGEAGLLVLPDPVQRRKTPLVLPLERIPRLDSGVRIRICYGE
uniref:Uncharacterized protein n=1 Tax=Tanacetum cinerariifolium TaxID=118510 RepID=A0A6L2MBS3_TANCI|nr:hypothetical protein [Tanacetum cinerariifolium]